jgi:hypothetical protein
METFLVKHKWHDIYCQNENSDIKTPAKFFLNSSISVDDQRASRLSEPRNYQVLKSFFTFIFSREVHNALAFPSDSEVSFTQETRKSQHSQRHLMVLVFFPLKGKAEMLSVGVEGKMCDV